MRRALVVASLVVSAAVYAPSLARAEVDIDVNLRLPVPPPLVVTAPPRLVPIPGSPVSYAPALPVDVFFYRGHYYRHHDHAWFHAPHYGGPWRHVEHRHVPRHVVAVPVHYYKKIPPGHLKKMEHGRWHGRGWHD